MYKEFQGIGCIADHEIPDRHAIIPLNDLQRLCKGFLFKPLWCRKDLSGHTSWDYASQIGTITNCRMEGCLMRVRGILHRALPKHTTETLGLSIDTNLSNKDLARRQQYGLYFGIPWRMNDFEPLGITVIYQHLCAINTTTFNLC